MLRVLRLWFGEKMYKEESSRADTRVVGGIVYWRGAHEHAR